MKSRNILFWTVIVLLHIIACWYAHSAGSVFTKDSAEYLQQAYNIAHFQTWYCGDFNEVIQPELYSQRPPMYGLVIMLIGLISQSTLAISIIQTFLSILNIYIAVLLITKYQPKFQTWLLLAIIFFPSQLIYANMIMSEMLLQTFIMLSITAIIFYVETTSLKYLLFFQLLVSAALMTKPIFIAFPIFSIVVLLLLPQLHHCRRQVLFSHTIPVLFILFVSYTNYKNTGYYEYSSIARKLSINYHALYSAEFKEGNTIALRKVDSIQDVAAQQTSYADKAKMIQSGAGRMIGEYLDAYAILTIKGIVVFFTDHSRYDIELFSGKKPDGSEGWKSHYQKNGGKGIIDYLLEFNLLYVTYLIVSVLFRFFFLAAFVRFCFLNEVQLYVRIVIAGTVLYVAFLTGMTGTTRFCLPVFLLIAIASAITLKFKSFPFLMKRDLREPE